MGLHLENLDQRTREYMVKEIEMDINNGNLYISGRLTETGRAIYPELLKDYAKHGDEEEFARKLKEFMALKEIAKKPGGGYTEKDIPYTANETLAEGEFNTYYIRGLCSRVIDEGQGELEIYRAKKVDNPRPESQAMLGHTVDPEQLLAELRDPKKKFNVIPKPNSGLSLRRR